MRQAGAATFVEIQPAELRTATLNGAPLTGWADRRLTLPDLRAENVLVVEAARAEKLLATGDLPPSVVRAVATGRAEPRRALASRAAFPAG